jgi:hypothetical protein
MAMHKKIIVLCLLALPVIAFLLVWLSFRSVAVNFDKDFFRPMLKLCFKETNIRFLDKPIDSAFISTKFEIKRASVYQDDYGTRISDYIDTCGFNVFIPFSSPYTLENAYRNLIDTANTKPPVRSLLSKVVFTRFFIYCENCSLYVYDNGKTIQMFYFKNAYSGNLSTIEKNQCKGIVFNYYLKPSEKDPHAPCKNSDR